MNIGDGKFVGSAAKVPYYNSILTLLSILEKAKSEDQPPNGQVHASIQNQAPVYEQQFGVHKQATSNVANEVNKANNRNAKIAFWLSIFSFILLFGSRFSLLLNLASYTLAIKYGLKSQKSGLAVAAIVINSIDIVILLLIMFI